MSVPAAYVGVILIWSTTPLAIQWSSEGVGFLFSAATRMAIGLLAGMLLAAVCGQRLPWTRAAKRTYVAAGLGIYGGLMLIYWSAQFLPSGWISVLFGTAPLVTGILASRLLSDDRLTPARIAGILLGLTGLSAVYAGGGSGGPDAVLGMAGVLAAVCCFSASSVAVRQVGAGLPGIVVTTGGLAVAAPLFIASFLLSGYTLPVAVPLRSGLAILYLGIVGSVLGFAMYYYILRQLGPTRVSLVTLVTPVISLGLGRLLNAEPLSAQVLVGAACILAGLYLFEFGPRPVRVRS